MKRRPFDDQDQSKACLGKRAYPDELTAQRSADRVAGRNWLAGRDSDMRAYRCVYCDGWHVGHKRDRSASPVSALNIPVTMFAAGRVPLAWEPLHTRHPEAWAIPRELWTEWREQNAR